MIQPQVPRQAIDHDGWALAWLVGLALAFVGQLIAWGLYMKGDGGLFLLGSFLVGLVVGRVTSGPWIAGLAGVTLAAVATGIGASSTQSGSSESMFVVVSGVVLGLGLFTPAYLFGSAARPQATDWTYPPVADREPVEGVWGRINGLSRRARMALGVILLECDVAAVAALFLLWARGRGP